MNTLKTDFLKPAFEWFGLWRWNGLDDAEDALGICDINMRGVDTELEKYAEALGKRLTVTMN